MVLSSLDIHNKTFQRKKIGGYNPDEVDDFLDNVNRDYEGLMTKNRELEKDLKHCKEKLSYFDELKDSLNESIIVAQDTASKVKSNAANEAEVIVKTANQHAEETLQLAELKASKLASDAEARAFDILTTATENAKKLAAETDDLKKKTRVFHQRLTLMLETQLETVKSGEWEEMLIPFSSYIEDEHQAFKELLDDQKETNGESEDISELPITEEIESELEDTIATELISEEVVLSEEEDQDK